MSIYGESMSLVTEGKIMDKIKKIFNKANIFKNKKKLIKIKQVDHIRDESIKEALQLKYVGVDNFFRDYKIIEKIESIFWRIDADSADKFIESVEDIFGTTDINNIKKLYRKYDSKEFSIDATSVDEANDFIDLYYVTSSCEVEYSVEALERYERENGKSNNTFSKAVKLQSDIFEFLFLITNSFIEDFENRVEEIYKEKNKVKEEN